MYQCLFLRLTIRVKIRIKTKKQQFGWNQIVCFHLFRILSKKKKRILVQEEAFLIYFVRWICRSIPAPSVQQVAHFVGTLKSAGWIPRRSGGSKEKSALPLQVCTGGPLPPLRAAPLGPAALPRAALSPHFRAVQPASPSSLSTVPLLPVPVCGSSLWFLWWNEIMSTILNIITYGCWIRAQV